MKQIEYSDLAWTFTRKRCTNKFQVTLSSRVIDLHVYGKLDTLFADNVILYCILHSRITADAEDVSSYAFIDDIYPAL